MSVSSDVHGSPGEEALGGGTTLALSMEAFERRVRPFVDMGVLELEQVLLLDVVAARFDAHDPDVLLALAFAMQAPSEGSVGVSLEALVAGWPDRVRDWHAHRVGDGAPGANVHAQDFAVPEMLRLPHDASAWCDTVAQSPLVGAVHEDHRPFAIQRTSSGTLLMSRRQWDAQRAIADRLHAMTDVTPSPPVDEAVALAFIDALREGFNPDSLDVAAYRALQDSRAIMAAAANALTVITGGPGTGKTFSVKRVLALLLSEAERDAAHPLRVVLAAPTGKAAARMNEAMAEDLAKLPFPETVKDRLRTLEARTLHKLLGARPDGTFRHGVDTPLEADVIVVDEASMIDVRLMRSLLDSVGPGARLILLGDRDQLASVDAGTVLSDIVSGAMDPARAVASARAKSLAACVVQFHTNHRFSAAPRIATVAQRIQRRQGDDLKVAAALLDPGAADPIVVEDPMTDRIQHLGVPDAQGRPTEDQLCALAAPYLTGDGVAARLGAAMRARGEGPALADPALHLELLEALDRYRVLAAHRQGPLGVSGLRREIDRRIRAHLQDAWFEGQRGVHLPSDGTWWLGAPVLVRENAYDVGLMNGDIGLVLPDGSGRLAAVFPERSEGRRSVRSVPLARLPASEGASVMTIHKSQGSQFDRVAMVLVGHKSPIQTRELIYTAITRARVRVDWLGDPDVLRDGLKTPVGRSSGLGSLLWDDT